MTDSDLMLSSSLPGPQAAPPGPTPVVVEWGLTPHPILVLARGTYMLLTHSPIVPESLQ